MAEVEGADDEGVEFGEGGGGGEVGGDGVDGVFFEAGEFFEAFGEDNFAVDPHFLTVSAGGDAAILSWNPFGRG